MRNKQKAWRTGAAAVNRHRRAAGRGLSARALNEVLRRMPRVKSAGPLLLWMMLLRGGYVNPAPVPEVI